MGTLKKIVDDCNCCMNHILDSVSRKLGKKVRLSKRENVGICPENGTPLYKYTFSCSGVAHGADMMHITATEEGVLFSLLELTMQCKSRCVYCPSLHDDNNCFQKQLMFGNINYSDIKHKDVPELHNVFL